MDFYWKYQLEVGMDTSIFKLHYNEYATLVTYIWIKHLCEFLWIHNITLETEDKINLISISNRNIHLVEWFRSR